MKLPAADGNISLTDKWLMWAWYCDGEPEKLKSRNAERGKRVELYVKNPLQIHLAVDLCAVPTIAAAITVVAELNRCSMTDSDG